MHEFREALGPICVQKKIEPRMHDLFPVASKPKLRDKLAFVAKF